MKIARIMAAIKILCITAALVALGYSQSTGLPWRNEISLRLAGPSLKQSTTIKINMTEHYMIIANSLSTGVMTAARSLGQVIMSNNAGNEVAGLKNEDANLSIEELIVKYGHRLEKHKVETEDGYKLMMFRIPGTGPPVFLMHGLLGSADDFVVAGPDSGLAYLLSKEGYDVWMGNARGNKYSRTHVQIKPSEPDFWNFSWHEIGYYDLPAMIDYVLNATGQEKLKYVGHSQGTTVFFVMVSERPEYNKKISLAITLSPVAFMSRMRSPILRMAAPRTNYIYEYLKSIGVNEFLPDTKSLRKLKKSMCGAGMLAEAVCNNLFFMVVGFGFKQLNMTNLPVIFGHVPSGAAGKQLAHYGQGIVSKEFRQFDYGATENKLKYGSEEPPAYNLGNIVAPISMFYSEADWLSDPRDVEELYSKLNSTFDIYKVPADEFNHLDFIWAKDFRKLIYERLIRLLKSF